MKKTIYTLLAVFLVVVGCQKDFYLEDLTEAQALITQLQEQLTAESTAKADTQALLDAQEEQIHSLSAVIIDLEITLKNTSDELTQKIVQITELEQTIVNLSEEVHTLITQIDTIIQENEVLSEEQQAQVETLNDEVEALQTLLDNQIIEYVEVVETITEIITVEVPVVETVTEIVTQTVTETVMVDNTDYTTIAAQVIEINQHLATINELRGTIEDLCATLDLIISAPEDLLLYVVAEEHRIPGVVYIDPSNIDLGNPVVTGDDCSGFTVSNDAPSTFAEGDTIVTWTITTGDGDTFSDIQIVTLQPTQVVITSFDFNTGPLPVGWTASPFTYASPCGDTSDGSNYFWADNAGLRFIQTDPLDVSAGGTVSFFIRYGSESGTGCNSPEPGDEVHLEYSTDGGVSWEVMASDWDADTTQTSPWYDWYHNDIDIPDAAKTSSTMFRWIQNLHFGVNWDNWGLDDISITSP